MLSTSLAIPLQNHLSSLGSISGRTHVQFLLPTSIRFAQLSLTPTTAPFRTTIIRMGGGPRTYPGGVSKWQWKRMQAKKAKQLLKARLARERQIYEMRKRAELKAAISELERPWEVVEKAPTLFSVGADEQLKVLADRFQKPDGFDMWSHRDGPELFKSDDGLPSSRFFPKGVVHSVKPYGKVKKFDDESDGASDFALGWGPEDESDTKTAVQGNVTNDKYAKKMRNGMNGGKNFAPLAEKNLNNLPNECNSGKGRRSTLIKNYDGTGYLSESTKDEHVRGSSKRDHRPRDNSKENRRRPNSREKVKESKSVVFDLSSQKDGSYELQQP